MRVQKQWVIPAVVGVISFGTGVAVGYLLAKRASKDEVILVQTEDDDVEEIGFKLDPDANWWHGLKEREEYEKKLSDEAYQREVEAIRQANMSRHPSSQPEPGPEEARPNPADITVDPVVLEPGYLLSNDAETNAIVMDEFIKHNRFATDTDDWNMEEELAYREANPDKPYVIHKDEFWAEETGYDQTTVTYYDVDDILVDQDDVPIYNYQNVIGPFRWGYGSGDPVVFHVRNDKLEAEYEVLFHEGESYSKEILGVELEETQPKRHPRKKIKPPRE